MMNGSSSEESDINIHVDYIFRRRCMRPLKKPSGRFSILHHTNTSYISSPGLVEEVAAAVRLPLILILISAVDIGVGAAGPSPQDPPPSAPATTSTVVAAMHEGHNLQDISFPMCMNVCSKQHACMFCGALTCVCERVSAIAAMH